MARPNTGRMEGRQLVVRLSVAERERLERLARVMGERIGGVPQTLAAVVRVALARGVESLERENKLSRSK